MHFKIIKNIISYLSEQYCASNSWLTDWLEQSIINLLILFYFYTRKTGGYFCKQQIFVATSFRKYLVAEIPNKTHIFDIRKSI